MVEFVVDVTSVDSWEALIEAFNKGFVRQAGGEWKGNFDALNDYLFWPDEHPFRLIVKGWNECVSNASSGTGWHSIPNGPTAFDLIQEIAAENPQANVEFR